MEVQCEHDDDHDYGAKTQKKKETFYTYFLQEKRWRNKAYFLCILLHEKKSEITGLFYPFKNHKILMKNFQSLNSWLLA